MTENIGLADRLARAALGIALDRLGPARRSRLGLDWRRASADRGHLVLPGLRAVRLPHLIGEDPC